jgi:PAS domain S-box-containing protein
MQSAESSNEYRDILYEMDEGFVILEPIFDEGGVAIDYRFLEYNKEFEQQTGWHNVVGKLRGELSTPIEEKWFQIYGRILKSGIPEHFESEAYNLRQYYEVRAFRLGGPQSRKVAVLFNNITRRKQAEEKLKKSELKHRRFYELGLIGIVFWKIDGKIIDANDKFLEMMNFTKEDLVLQTIDWQKITPGEYLKEGITNFPYEREILRKDGTKIYVLISSSMLNEENAEVVSFILDITERRKSEKLRAQLSDIIKSTNEAIISKDLNGNILTWNSGAEKMYGYKSEEVIGKNISILIPPGEKNEIPDFIRKILQGETIGNYETLRIRKDGTIIPVSINLSPVHDENGLISAVTKITHDISLQKEMEEALRESEQRWVTTLSCIGDAVVAMDAKKRITFINREAENLTGWSLNEVFHKPANHFLNIIDESTSISIEYSGISEVRVTAPSDQLKLINREGKEIPVDYTASPILTREGKNLGIVIIFRDITNQKKADQLMKDYNLQLEETVRARTSELESSKERAESADRLKTAFLLNMSHELRTPLNSIIGFSGILLKQLAGPLNDEQEKQLEMVLKSGRHLLSLINDILDISKIEAGELKPSYSSFDFSELIIEVIKLVESKAHNKGLRITFQNSATSSEIISDKIRLRQIMINLIFNAVKFTECGEIKIKLWQENEFLKVDVSDTGIGIRKEDLEKLFNPFTQLENSLTRVFDGSGLGLSISKKLIDMLQGNINVKSEFGQGSTFTISLKKQGNIPNRSL